VLAGEELSCSYLGQKGLAPEAPRRAYLQGVYGFHCQVSWSTPYGVLWGFENDGQHFACSEGFHCQVS
jgi:hypothetical protein